jgi:hypothetical protein
MVALHAQMADDVATHVAFTSLAQVVSNLLARLNGFDVSHIRQLLMVRSVDSPQHSWWGAPQLLDAVCAVSNEMPLLRLTPSCLLGRRLGSRTCRAFRWATLRSRPSTLG